MVILGAISAQFKSSLHLYFLTRIDHSSILNLTEQTPNVFFCLFFEQFKRQKPTHITIWAGFRFYKS